MRVAVFGATGMAGSAIVDEAVARGHEVTAASRTPGTSGTVTLLAVRAVDVSDVLAVASVLAEVDAAVLTIRPTPGQEHRLAPLTAGFLDAAVRSDVRVLVVGGSAPLRSPDDPHRLVIDTRYVPEQYRAIARASIEQHQVCLRHGHADCTYLSPPAILEPGARTGRYRRGTTTLLVHEDGTSRITTSDLAIAVVDELEAPTGQRHITVVGYAAP